MLAGISLTVLVCKYCLPSEKRHGTTFALDIVKQQTGMFFAHCMNLWLAVNLSQDSNGSGCVWYMMNFLVDVVLGGILYVVFQKMFNKYVFNRPSLHVSPLKVF